MHLILDLNFLTHRVLHLPVFQEMKTKAGMPTGGVFGVLQSIHSALGRFPMVRNCTVVWDSGHSPRRKQLYPDYKSSRYNEATATEEDKQYHQMFLDQKKYITYILSKLAIRVLEIQGTEADDVIFWLTNNLPGAKIVMSDDKDFYQTIKADTILFRPMHDETVTLENFAESFGWPKEKYFWVRALLGDSSDNIKGIPGVGETTSRDIMSKASTWEQIEVYCTVMCNKRYSAVIANKNILERNIELMDMSREVFSPAQVASIQAILAMPARVSVTKVFEFVESLEMQSIIGKDTSFTDLGRWLAPFHLLH